MSRRSSPVVRRAASALVLSLCATAVGGCLASAEAPAGTQAAWVTEWHAWRAEREEQLRDPTSYLGLSDLIWLESGAHNLGSDPNADLLLPPSCGDRLGQLAVADGRVGLVAAPGAVVDQDGLPIKTALLYGPGVEGSPRLRAGEVTFWVIERGGRLALRVSDPASPVLGTYDGTETWPPRQDWRVPACFVPNDEPVPLAVPNVLGGHYDELCHGRLVFNLAGASHELLVTGRDERSLTVLFGDRTNGVESHAGGRVLQVPYEGGTPVLMLDFNRAENLPCAYSPFTTCPMPPEGNLLPLAVTAGEKAWHGRQALGGTPLP